MHEILLRLVTTPHASYLMETFMQSAGPLIVGVVGALLLARILRRLLFRSVAEGGAGIDRRFLTDPRPADALECRATSNLLTIYRR
jgi:hypothetical protein